MVGWPTIDESVVAGAAWIKRTQAAQSRPFRGMNQAYFSSGGIGRPANAFGRGAEEIGVLLLLQL